MGTHHSGDYKLHAVKHFIKYKNATKTCETFECKRTSLIRWIKRYINTGSVENNKRPLISYKLTEEHIKYAKLLLKNNKLLTLPELNKLLKLRFNNYNISSRWLGKVLIDNHITRKRTKRTHFPETRYGNIISYENEVKELFNKIKKYTLEDIISIDETSIKPNMIKEYCRSEKGVKCYYKSTDNRVFRKYTLIVAISINGIVGYKLYEKGGINTERFLNFINETILSKYKNKLLLFDNGRAHTSSIVLNKIKEHNDYVFNVPYTPKFNPIENFFSQLKHYLKLDSKIDFNELNESLKKSINKIKRENYRNYFYNSLDISKLPKYKKQEYINKHKYKN